MAKNDFTVGLLVGGALGAVLALLYAPAPGEETRHNLGDKASDLGSTVKEKASEVGATVKDRASEVGATVKEKATEYGSTIRETASHVGSTVREKVATLKHGDEPVTAADIKDAATDVVEEVKSDLTDSGDTQPI